MTNETIATETHAHHGWPIRVVCEFQVTEGKFAARSFVTPAGMAERAIPDGVCVDALSSDARLAFDADANGSGARAAQHLGTVPPAYLV